MGGERTDIGTIAGVRGAIVAKDNARDTIVAAARRLLVRVVESNGIEEHQVAAIFFTATPDLDAAFPAAAVRSIGWRSAPALCAREIPVPGALERVIRVLVLVNGMDQRHVSHQYIGRARALRPDLADGLPTDKEMRR